jgi:hypothetical protein
MSQFASGSIGCSDLGGFVELERCDLDGRLACGVHSAIEPTTALRGIFGFYGSSIRGQVHLCTGSPNEIVSWVDLRDARFAGGSFSISVSPISENELRGSRGGTWRYFEVVRNWIWKSSWDESAFVLDEALAAAVPGAAFTYLPQRIQRFPDAREPNVRRQLHAEAYSQYDELQQVYTQTAGADDLEDFCKYRMGIHRSSSATKLEDRLAAPLCILLLAFTVFAWLLDAASIFGWQSMAVLVGLLAICGTYFYRDVGSVFQFMFNELVLRHMLGHGVILRRVLISGVGVIMAFALVFVAISTWSGEPASNGVFYTINSTDLPISWDGAEQKDNKSGTMRRPAGVFATFRRATYFSTVTFTTLGYGDLLPRGKARFVAGIEALTGALYMSMLVVVLARRHLRM